MDNNEQIITIHLSSSESNEYKELEQLFALYKDLGLHDKSEIAFHQLRNFCVNTNSLNKNVIHHLLLKLEEGKKIAIFSSFGKTTKNLKNQFESLDTDIPSFICTGETPKGERGRGFDLFNKSIGPSVLFATDAVSIGYHFKDIECIFHIDVSDASLSSQRNARIKRISTNPCSKKIFYFSIKGTIHEKLVRKCIEKQNIKIKLLKS